MDLQQKRGYGNGRSDFDHLLSGRNRHHLQIPDHGFSGVYFLQDHISDRQDLR